VQRNWPFPGSVLAVYAVEVDTEAREFLQRTLQDYPEQGELIHCNAISLEVYIQKSF
jgi:hypothetical protein